MCEKQENISGVRETKKGRKNYFQDSFAAGDGVAFAFEIYDFVAKVTRTMVIYFQNTCTIFLFFCLLFTAQLCICVCVFFFFLVPNTCALR